MKTPDQKQGPIIHKILPADFIVRVKDFKRVLAEVETDSLEKTLDYFKRDQNPESELKVWEKIAVTYQWAVIGNPGLTKEQKKDVFAVVLGLSIGTKDFSNCKSLSKEQIAGIVNRFS